MNKIGGRLKVAALAAVASMMLPAALSAQDKKPDFSGIWGAAIDSSQLKASCGEKEIDAFARENERSSHQGAAGTKRWITFEQDCAIRNRGQVNKPLYKPELWEKVRLSDYNANAGGDLVEYADPEWQNLPRGVPRIGPPNKVVQTPDEIILLYEHRNTFRAVPTDCRAHDPVLSFDQSVNGHAVGCWDGDTLVVTSLGFSDRTWLHWSGYFHSTEMKVIEKFRLDGETLVYDVTVEDPTVFLEPWVMDTRKLKKNTTPGAFLMEDLPYDDRSLGALVDPQYRG